MAERISVKKFNVLYMEKTRILFFAIVCLLNPLFLSAQRNFMDSVSSAGINRTFRVYIPESYNSASAYPLVLALHGNTQTSVTFEERLKFRQIADTAGFILITPDGLVDPGFPQSGQGWNVFTCCAKQNDVLFIADLIDYASQKYKIDTERVYVAGFSMGGFMVYELAAKLNHRIAAFASVSGSIETARLPSYRASTPVPIVEFHGTKDRLCPYTGGQNEGMDFVSTDTLLHFWASVNHCSGVIVTTELENKNLEDGSTVQHIQFQNCAPNSAVELYKVTDGGHRWPGIELPNSNKDILAEQEIWRFFSKYKL